MEDRKELPRPKRGEILGISPESPWREELIGAIVDINEMVPLEKSDQVLIVIVLDTEEKIYKWFQWLKTVLVAKENKINATAVEIVQAAVFIGKGLEPTD